VRTTSQPVSALLVDAVAHAASRADETPAAPTTLPSLALTGSTDLTDAGAGLSRTAMAPFERALAGDHRGLVVLARGMIVLSGASNGPSEASRSIVAHALGSLVDRAARTLREPLLARAELVLDDGRTVGWAAFAPRSHLALVTFTDDGVGTSAKVDRLVGALRRSFDEQPGAALAALAAHGAA
jgi:hypothetical protein